MKKLIAAFLLTFVLVNSACTEESFAFSPNSEIRKWESFFGLSGGVGIFGGSSTEGVLNFGFNDSWREKSPLGLSYSGEILGGWQKYTSEKIGTRHTLGFSFAYAPNMTSIRTGNLSYRLCVPLFCSFASDRELDPSNRYAFQYGIDYSFEGLFDFIKNGKTRFGMTLGLAVGIMGTVWETFQGERKFLGGVKIDLGIQSGLYIRSGNDGLDLTLRLPLIEMSNSFGPTIFHNSLFLGYKHFF